MKQQSSGSGQQTARDRNLEREENEASPGTAPDYCLDKSSGHSAQGGHPGEVCHSLCSRDLRWESGEAKKPSSHRRGWEERVLRLGGQTWVSKWKLTGTGMQESAQGWREPPGGVGSRSWKSLAHRSLHTLFRQVPLGSRENSPSQKVALI